MSNTSIYESGKHGNKTKNLSILQDLLKGEEKLYVPDFIGLAHDDICSHLKRFGLDIEVRWQAIADAMSKPEVLNDQTKELLKILSSDIRACLSTHPIQELALPKGARLMVRSTGKEDSKEIANAGGNESVANVVPDINSVSNAIAEVLCSYLGEKSLLQRQLAHDDISTPPFIPILIQTMIGSESDITDDKIVKSGVAYSNNSGTFIQIAPGHGELIVNSKGAVDSYWYTKNHVVIADIVNKPVRMVPQTDGNAGLKTIPNSHSLAKAPSIPPAVVERLAKCADKINRHYGMPMDIEFVYVPEHDAIYIVQARPIVNAPNLAQPSALHPNLIEQGKEKQAWLAGHSIVPPGNALPLAHVREVTKADDVFIIKKMNNDALKQCIELARDNRVKVVVVEQLLADISHEAAIINGAGLPLIQISNTAELSKALDTVAEANPLYFDRQRNGFLLASKLEKIVLDRNEWIQPGLIASSLDSNSTPLPIGINPHVSVDLTVLTDKRTPLAELIVRVRNPEIAIAEPAVNELLAHFYALMGNDHSRKTTTNEARIACQTVLTNLSEANNVQAGRAIAQLLRYAFQINKKLDTQSSHRAFQNLVLVAADYYEARHAEPGQEQAEYLLDLAKKIEGLIFGKGRPEDFGYSLHALLEERKLQESIAKQCQRLFGQNYQQLTAAQKVMLVTLIPFNIYFLNANDKTAWSTFCFNIVKQGLTTADELLQFLLRLQEEKLLEAAACLIVLPAITADSPVDYNELINQLSSFVEFKSTQLATHYSAINDFENQISLWGEKGLSHDMFIQRLNELKQLGVSVLKLKKTGHEQYLISQLKFKYIELLDNSIKALKANSALPVSDKIDRFTEMLKIYKISMETLVRCDIDQATFQKLRNTDVILTDNEPKTPWERINAISLKFDTLLKQNNFGEDQLLSSGEFSVDAAIINTAGSFKRAFIDMRLTLEDFFTFFHQECLACIETETNPYLIKTERLPEHIQQVVNSLDNMYWLNREGKTSKATLLQSEFNFPDLTYSYNMPLRNHAAKFDIKIDVVTGVVTIGLVLIGVELNSRMEQIPGLIRLDCMASGNELLDLTKKHAGANIVISKTIRTSLDKLAARLHENPQYLTEYFIKYFDVTAIGTDEKYKTPYPSIIWTIENHRYNFDIFIDKLLTSLEKDDWALWMWNDGLFRLQWRSALGVKATNFPNTAVFYSLLADKIKHKITNNPSHAEVYECLFDVINPKRLGGNWFEIDSLKTNSSFINKFLRALPQQKFNEILQVIDEQNTLLFDEIAGKHGLMDLISAIVKENLWAVGSEKIDETLKNLQINDEQVKNAIKTDLLGVFDINKVLMFARLVQKPVTDNTESSIQPADIKYLLNKVREYNNRMLIAQQLKEIVFAINQEVEKEVMTKPAGSAQPKAEPKPEIPASAPVAESAQPRAEPKPEIPASAPVVESAPPKTEPEPVENALPQQPSVTPSKASYAEEAEIKAKKDIINLLEQYTDRRKSVTNSKNQTKEYYFGSFLGIFQKSFTQKQQAIITLKSALDNEQVDLLAHLSTFRNGDLGKQLREFIKAGKADILVNNKQVRTVSDFIRELHILCNKAQENLSL
ncbi:PEP/pyruvate-binding domain-containing protein [Legionella dresdenensis]|uniref:Phosphoenolpyruvate synthase n=1 Tax=Legionella dresdenensis TaxID=450200 RepID=A0ABV8CHX0_9GAMM